MVATCVAVNSGGVDRRPNIVHLAKVARANAEVDQLQLRLQVVVHKFEQRIIYITRRMLGGI